jgi:hypothetical protein
MVRRDFSEEREAEHLALVAALIEACEFCDRPENRERVMETLAQPEYLDAPIRALRMSMNGTFDFGHGRIGLHPPAFRRQIIGSRSHDSLRCRIERTGPAGKLECTRGYWVASPIVLVLNL